MPRLKQVLLYVMAAVYLVGGVAHFVITSWYLRIMPPWIPWHLAMVYISGVAEIVLGIAVLVPNTRRLAAWGIIALLIAIFPANVHMALTGVPIDGEPIAPSWALWLRLPLQGVLIAWAYWYTKPANP